jgi:hypothetical protein
MAITEYISGSIIRQGGIRVARDEEDHLIAQKTIQDASPAVSAEDLPSTYCGMATVHPPTVKSMQHSLNVVRHITPRVKHSTTTATTRGRKSASVVWEL